MKKVLSFAMALVMMMAVMVPAFAVELNANPDSADVVIDTSTLKDTDGDGIGDTDAEEYTVTIPAKVDICWGATYTNIPFTVECHLETGKVLDFDVEGQNGYLLKDGVLGAIPYALLNGNFSLTDSVVPETYVDDVLTIFILPEHWGQVPIDNYADLVTFNVSIKTQ